MTQQNRVSSNETDTWENCRSTSHKAVALACQWANGWGKDGKELTSPAYFQNTNLEPWRTLVRRKFGRPNTAPTPQSKMWARIWPPGRMLLNAGQGHGNQKIQWIGGKIWPEWNPRFLHVFTSCSFLFPYNSGTLGFLDCSQWKKKIPSHWYPWRSRYDESEWYLATAPWCHLKHRDASVLGVSS